MIVVVVVLAVVIAAQLLERHLERRAWATERAHLVHLAVARHPGDVVALERPAVKAKRADDDRPPPIPVGA